MARGIPDSGPNTRPRQTAERRTPIGIVWRTTATERGRQNDNKQGSEGPSHGEHPYVGKRMRRMFAVPAALVKSDSLQQLAPAYLPFCFFAFFALGSSPASVNGGRSKVFPSPVTRGSPASA